MMTMMIMMIVTDGYNFMPKLVMDTHVLGARRRLWKTKGRWFGGKSSRWKGIMDDEIHGTQGFSAGGKLEGLSILWKDSLPGT